MLLVMVTMAAAVIISTIGAAIAELLGGNAEAAGGALFVGLFGGAVVFGPMLIVGFLPSLLTFATVYRLTGGEAARPVSAEYAGVATAAVASVFWVALLTWINGDGAETVVGVVGIAAILIAPRVARWAYRERTTLTAAPAEVRIG